MYRSVTAWEESYGIRLPANKRRNISPHGRLGDVGLLVQLVDTMLGHSQAKQAATLTALPHRALRMQRTARHKSWTAASRNQGVSGSLCSTDVVA
jgi:hypothetical protein